MQVSGGAVLFHRIYGVPVLKKVLNTAMSAVSGEKVSCVKHKNKNHLENLFADQFFFVKTFTTGNN